MVIKMRVITGTSKGVNLNALSGTGTRPTTDKVKEAVFSAIQAIVDIEGATVLDLFAGSGQLGIEALSRGAKKAYFNDNNPKAAMIIRENLKKTGFGDSRYSRVGRLPYSAFMRLVKDEFDIVFLDPPYEKGIIEKALPLAVSKMNTGDSGGVIVCEHEKSLILPEKVGVFGVEKVYLYGSINVTIYTPLNQC
ncbi:MAG: 16S rRNA (guanine(966)-N(2))-methyltransferase RsmD [Oscillospiraceae bacterium]|nr:16S rRNA (guanine(966)-N(2))-methyltransferase RsmD [Oscillospiraceae bacterium]